MPAVERGAGRLRGRLVVAVAAAVFSMTAVGCGQTDKPAAARPVTVHFPGAVGGPATPVMPNSAGGPTVDLSGSPTRAAPTVGVPKEVDIPSIGVHSAVEQLGRQPDGSLQVPSRFDTVGWYNDGPRPGDPGPAVVAGHVDSYSGPAVFYRLRSLVAGATVLVQSDTGTVQFRVDSVASFPKSSFPSDLVFGSVPDRALRLITCGGSFDRQTSSYRDNIIIFASEVTS